MARPLPDQGMVGTFAACARMVLPILSPKAAMGAAGGPRNRMPDGWALKALGSSGFSDAWPLQGCTAVLASHNVPIAYEVPDAMSGSAFYVQQMQWFL